MALHLASDDPHIEPGPEETFISALIDTGKYSPAAFQVRDEWFVAHRNVHEFCKRVQEIEGCAPDADLVQERFPSFRYSSGMPLSFAAYELRNQVTGREMNRDFARQGQALINGNYALAADIAATTGRRFQRFSARGADALAFDLIDSYESTHRCPVPQGHLTDLTGGHPAGELWLVSAKWGVGKSWRLVEHAVAALEGGWDVLFFSMEMSTAEILKRIHTVALRAQPFLVMDKPQLREAVTNWYAGCGSLSVFGPDHGAVDTAVIAGALSTERTLVCLDYAGRMYSNTGTPATEDYKAVAAISRELCELAGTHNVPIFAGAQLNAQGSLAGSMELERAPHLIVEMGRVSDECDGVRVNTIRKSRGTVSGSKWYTRFDAVRGRFEDITREEALEIRTAEETLPFK